MDRQTLVLILSSAMIILLSSSAASAQHSPAAPPPSEEDSCAGVIAPLTPCLNYLRKRDNKPSQSCCNGAKKLSDQAKTKEQRQEACKCIKQALGSISDIDPSRIPQIPEQCGIPATLPPIDRNFDCSTSVSVLISSSLLLSVISLLWLRPKRSSPAPFAGLFFLFAGFSLCSAVGGRLVSPSCDCRFVGIPSPPPTAHSIPHQIKR
ncbi:putative non-specific lipid-transfer protein 2 [Morus notabilis]|uniref:Non-specific lipid-transfer protein n=1 Tax=Morus notabilis TaxID=981085 RepID=W9RN86_9ROSA|nr:putative non-specific lipid-transfer protein 2 [Morus notabilis]